MAFLDSNKSDAWLVSALQHHASFTHGSEFTLQHIQKLALADSIPVKHNASGLEASVPVELDEQFPHHES